MKWWCLCTLHCFTGWRLLQPKFTTWNPGRSVAPSTFLRGLKSSFCGGGVWFFFPNPAKEDRCCGSVFYSIILLGCRNLIFNYRLWQRIHTPTSQFLRNCSNQCCHFILFIMFVCMHYALLFPVLSDLIYLVHRLEEPVSNTDNVFAVHCRLENPFHLRAAWCLQ